jgi:hypothetical protein
VLQNKIASSRSDNAAMSRHLEAATRTIRVLEGRVGGGGDRGPPPPLHSSVHQVPILVKPQCTLLGNLGYPLRSSVQMTLGQQNLSAH